MSEKELKEHYHGEIMEEHFRRMYFINCNIFLGGEYNKTWYKDIGYTHNDFWGFTPIFMRIRPPSRP